MSGAGSSPPAIPQRPPREWGDLAGSGPDQWYRLGQFSLTMIAIERRLRYLFGLCPLDVGVEGITPVEQHLQSVYLYEVAKQGQFAMNAVRQVNVALRSLAEPPDQFSMPTEFAQDEVFRGIHSFFTFEQPFAPALAAYTEGQIERKGHRRPREVLARYFGD